MLYFGCSPRDRRISISPFVVGDSELTLQGSHNNPCTIAKAARLLASGKIKAEHVISHKIPLSEIHEAFSIFGIEGVNKIMITP